MLPTRNSHLSIKQRTRSAGDAIDGIRMFIDLLNFGLALL